MSHATDYQSGIDEASLDPTDYCAVHQGHVEDCPECEDCRYPTECGDERCVCEEDE